MKRQWIITIKVNQDVTGTVGPFPDEETADRYCRIYLEPNLKGSTFHMSDLENPEQFIRDLLKSIG